jgi:hypothetical protein
MVTDFIISRIFVLILLGYESNKEQTKKKDPVSGKPTATRYSATEKVWPWRKQAILTSFLFDGAAMYYTSGCSIISEKQEKSQCIS